MTRPGWVYIMASQRNGTIYIGVTSDLPKRAWQHRSGIIPGFTKVHGCKLLVWCEFFSDLQDARVFELRMKKWNRDWKLRRIEERNPQWRDLFEEICA